MGWLPVFGLAFFTLQEGVQKQFVSSTSSTWDFHHPENLKGPTFVSWTMMDRVAGAVLQTKEIFSQIWRKPRWFSGVLALRVEVFCSMKGMMVTLMIFHGLIQVKWSWSTLSRFAFWCQTQFWRRWEQWVEVSLEYFTRHKTKLSKTQLLFEVIIIVAFHIRHFQELMTKKNTYMPFLRFRCRSVVHLFQPFPVMVSWFSRPWYQTHREGLGRVHEALRGSGGLLLMCWGLNSQCFPLVGMVREPYSRGWYTHKDSLVKVGWPLLV